MAAGHSMAICIAHEVLWAQRSRLYHLRRDMLFAIRSDDIAAPEVGQPCHSGGHDCPDLFVASKDAEHGGTAWRY